ncbi:hypothetical protein [Rhodoblastus sp.]|uniref:hypothetical protein n=1 Tax=Rhodoblastus sp. TaxID=1962975 RepID=UPI0035B410BD
MNIRVVAFALALSSLSGAAYAGSTPDEDAACRPDVRKFCHRLPPNASDAEFLSCLQENRQKLSTPCRKVLEGHGV